MRRRAHEGVCEVDYVDSLRARAAVDDLPEPVVLGDAAAAFGIMGHQARLKILKALDSRELCVCDIAQVLGASMSGTSQHLKELRNIGAVTFRAEGKLAYYRLTDPVWLTIVNLVLDHFSSAAAAALPGKNRGKRKAGAS